MQYLFGWVAVCCEVQDHDRIVCQTNQGTGKDHAWQVVVGGQTSSINRANSSYGPPVIIDYKIVRTGLEEFDTSGGQRVIVSGRNFGHDISKVELLTYGMASVDEFTVDMSTCSIWDLHNTIASIS